MYKELKLIDEGKAYFYKLAGDDKKPVMIVCPGGGYQHVSKREGEPVAMQFSARGYHSCVVNYSVAPKQYPTQLLQLAQTVKILRDNADEWHIDSDRIYVIGFSAGGHLTGSLAVHWDKPILEEQLGRESSIFKPNGVILCYPVINDEICKHTTSFKMLTGGDKALDEFLSLDQQVGKQVCPVFLWHTVTDQRVEVENSLMMAMALKKHQIPFEMHLYDRGVHGLSLCNALSADGDKERLIDPHIESWLKLAFEWLERLNDNTEV